MALTIPGTGTCCNVPTQISDIVLIEFEPGRVYGVCGNCQAILDGLLWPRHERRLRSMGATSVADEISQFLASAEAV
jgi:hypothetical protein